MISVQPAADGVMGEFPSTVTVAMSRSLSWVPDGTAITMLVELASLTVVSTV
ncbi:MAG: hypothetical protein FJ029_11880 [Actinobacteria bacterium]|nr:hypothetical protein [Actinomycetota bacterium]